jgi:tetratricopeptide (TPR) repeat protein
VKKQQYFLVGGGFLLLILLYFFGNTVPPAKRGKTPAQSAQHTDNHNLTDETILAEYKKGLSPSQSIAITQLENEVKRGDVKDQQIHTYHQLARFWSDSVKAFEPYAIYSGSAAKLENSEKSLTFAARLYLDRLMTAGNPALQQWLAGNAKELFEKALSINPANDSSKIGLGACYILGNISSNPMEGILPIRQIVEKNPNNAYGQMILGLGGKISGQYDKAIERFLIVTKLEPNNLDAIFNLAEVYELKGEKKTAADWYEKAKQKIDYAEIRQELDKRIIELRK